MGRIGIFGGSFNPPHTGHVAAADFAVRALALDRLYVVPANCSPGKQADPADPGAQQRLELTKLAFAPVEKAEVCDLEIRRGGVSYTADTVLQLRQKHPDDTLILLMGADMFLEFTGWKRPQQILQNARLAVLYRSSLHKLASLQEQRRKIEEMGGQVCFVENPVQEISSTQLRRLLAFDCARPFLPEGTVGYLQQHRLYRPQLRKLSLQQLESAVIRLLKPQRVAHVLGCRDTAVALARRWGADETDAARAGLLHDVTKALDGPLQLTICSQYSILLDSFSQQNPKTLHALTGSLVAQRIFGENAAVVDAICSHTTGKADMNTLQKIIYVADYMEPNRDFPGVEQLRHLAFTDLDGALRLGLEMTLTVLRQQGSQISPQSQQAIDWLDGKI